MYKSYGAQDYKRHFGIGDEYRVDSFLIFGTFKQFPYDMLKETAGSLGLKADYTKRLTHAFFDPILEFVVGGKTYWFVVAYGGTMLSEWLHLACLFGSRKNILLGSCGGLYKDAVSPDIIVPTYSAANESATRLYEPQAHGKHRADRMLSDRLAGQLALKHKVWRGPTVTCQAMMAETWDDVQRWALDGYYGVEMEAATVFAVSNHFSVPSAAAVLIGDNLIQEQTVMDINYEEGRDRRRQVTRELFEAAMSELHAG